MPDSPERKPILFPAFFTLFGVIGVIGVIGLGTCGITMVKPGMGSADLVGLLLIVGSLVGVLITATAKTITSIIKATKK